MSFKIVYVENSKVDYQEVENALKVAGTDTVEIFIEHAETPEKLMYKLRMDSRYDLVIADVLYDDDDGNPDKVDRLDEIIKTVHEWAIEKNSGRLLPIIAYTGGGAETLNICLSKKTSLFDIWDKNTAKPEYVAWRLSELAKKLTRSRPDALLQRYIREMKTGASWHKYVKQMAKDYNAGLTERDQIIKAGVSIKSIAGKLDIWEMCQPLWEGMIEWEALSRAISTVTRGHSRHTVNVFWLGYYLLHHKELSPLFIKAWEKLKDDRSEMAAVKDDEALEALSGIWFCAGIFHDIAGCIEKTKLLQEFHGKIVGKFKAVPIPTISFDFSEKDNLISDIQEMLHIFKSPLREKLTDIFKESVMKSKPDHGLIGAFYLYKSLPEGKQAAYIREAIRAIILHNVIADCDQKISWGDEPIACLLILCDQIQTWDRERNDETRSDKEKADRAELSELNIRTIDGMCMPTVELNIDYIAPDYLLTSYESESYYNLKASLEDVLHDKPFRALNKIQKGWPLRASLNFSLSGDTLSVTKAFQ